MDGSSSITSYQRLRFSVLFWLGQLGALICIIAGLAIIFVQTPVAKATLHWNSAFTTYSNARKLEGIAQQEAYKKARALALEALRYNAHDADLWFRFANLETRIAGVLTPNAEQALEVAAALNPRMATKINLYKDQLKLIAKQKSKQGVAQ